jgi:NADH-quinone oxidoreductase subunit F
MDDTVCMVWALMVLERFFHHESCGQCTPCREGTGWLHRVLVDLEEGRATPRDVDLLLDVAGNMMGTTICALSDAAAMPTRAFVTKYRAEFEEHAALGRCPFRSPAEPRRAHAHP